MPKGAHKPKPKIPRPFTILPIRINYSERYFIPAKLKPDADVYQTLDNKMVVMKWRCVIDTSVEPSKDPLGIDDMPYDICPIEFGPFDADEIVLGSKDSHMYVDWKEEYAKECYNMSFRQLSSLTSGYFGYLGTIWEYGTMEPYTEKRR